MRAQWRYAPAIRHWVLAEWTEAGEPATEYGSVLASSLTAVAPALRPRISEAMWKQHGIRPPAEVFDGEPGAEVTMTCPVCWHVSWDAEDARARRCPRAGEHPAPAVPRQREGEPAAVAE